jgi:hypothetical protein
MKSMKMKSHQGMKWPELSTLTHHSEEIIIICFMLTLFWTVSAAKSSVAFTYAIPTFTAISTCTTHYKLLYLNVPVKYNYA